MPHRHSQIGNKACPDDRHKICWARGLLLPEGLCMLTERRVLITGGAGFIGSHRCDRLLERGDEVLCVDNFYTGTRRKVHHLLTNPRFELMRHDICFPLYIEVDEIFNLACRLRPFTTNLIPCKLRKSACTRGSICLGPPSA